MNQLDFKGRHAIITGGATGLGFAIAERLVASGGNVTLWDRDEAAVQAAAKRLGAAGGAYTLDVTHEGQVAAAVQQGLQSRGRIDALVNSAGITGPNTTVWDYPVDAWKQVMDVNLNGLFYCCREVAPFMIANGYGRIVNVASVAGKEGNPNASAYSASKAGVIGLTKSLGKELATKGVIANSLTPATFESPILEQLPQSQVDYMRGKIPMGRLGEIHESAAMVCFMASEECSFTTGATFDTSGGRTTF
jgi:NAD(P)-dependent dehydrogenase (short-subunit alcohol dehydrogenase family)